jgi:hypothetical protein
MSRFEYLSVLVSIVIALGISDLTIAWARVLQNRLVTKFCWLHAFWSVFSLFLMIQFWWGFWRYRTIGEWSLGGLLLVVAVVISLTMCALMLSPRTSPEANVDLRTTYFDNARNFFTLGALFVALITVMETLILAEPLLAAQNLFRGFGVAGALAIAFSTSTKVHVGFAILGTAILAGFLATTTSY